MDKDKMRKGIIAMLEGLIPMNSTWCEVVSVTDQECTVKIDDLEIEGILLGFDKSDVIVYPKVNTNVLVAFVDNSKTNGVVIRVEQTDKIEIMGSNYGGIPILNEIKNNLDAIKDYLTAQNSAIEAGFIAVGIGTAANGTNGKTVYDSAMASQAISFSDMENTKVKHGNG
jgi:hypothetical protein